MAAVRAGYADAILLYARIGDAQSVGETRYRLPQVTEAAEPAGHITRSSK